MQQGLPYKLVKGRTKPTPLFRKQDILEYLGDYFSKPQISQNSESERRAVGSSQQNTDDYVKANKDENLIDIQILDDSINSEYTQLKKKLAEYLIQKVKSCSPKFFEQLVVDLLIKMGYGGTREDAGERLGKSGDGGIDGIIKQDRFGLDVIYLQAKRWEGVVGRPEIHKFVGALEGQNARKGVFITTSNFTKEAKDFVKTISKKIILINGEELAELMIDYNVGVSVATTYEIKKIDSDYFSEE